MTRQHRHPLSSNLPRISATVDVRLPSDLSSSPGKQLLRRLFVGIGIVVVMAMLTYVEREGYTDSADGKVSLLDAFYYSTVAVTTTGYGDIAPVSDEARLVTTLLVTPLRMAFLVLLVGTSVELIALATQSGFRKRLWRKRVRDHVVICGFGVKGRNALRSLEQLGYERDAIVIIDRDRESVETAVAEGYAAVIGNMTRNDVLDAAGVGQARTVMIAPDRDDTAVLTVLSARALSPTATIVATAREVENAVLLRNSGADSVLTSAGATGHMLGLTVAYPHTVAVVEDLLEPGRGFDLVERIVTPQEEGLLSKCTRPGELVIAVFRGHDLITRTPGGSQPLKAGDSIVSIKSVPEGPAREPSRA